MFYAQNAFAILIITAGQEEFKNRQGVQAVHRWRGDVEAWRQFCTEDSWKKPYEGSIHEASN